MLLTSQDSDVQTKGLQEPSNMPMTDTERALMLFLTAVGFFFISLIWNLYVQFGWERDGVGQLDKHAAGAMELDRLASRQPRFHQGLGRENGVMAAAAYEIDRAA
ncbi:hypothetical protein PV08_01085 [Exophiala spinifera]|uniref:Uncharacterized protein n=1 Tax=Exophiala spinifera TaxID=91928 RepID=A0A0D2BPU0_9EURO|nr:uncharacterized protein PV08_01085 [Exophiala spinifera]KIW20510.1 hypothetical protein PV08_01085 [Exophiala spinifera]